MFRRLVALPILAGRTVGGPDDPGACLDPYGDELPLGVLHQVSGPDCEFVMRYISCAHNGFDDGTTVRALTAASVQPLLTGANRLHHIGGPAAHLGAVEPPGPDG